jgi:hypothetical protein
MSPSLKQAVPRVLRDAEEPIHCKEIAIRILDGGLSKSNPKTPGASLSAVLAGAPNSVFEPEAASIDGEKPIKQLIAPILELNTELSAEDGYSPLDYDGGTE